MKTIIAGSRTILDYNLVEEAVKRSGFEITEVVSGGARGVDALGEHYSFVHSIPLKIFKAEWGLYGRGAGYRRNYEMARYAEALVCVWDGVSKGAAHMIHTARAENLKTFIFNLMLEGKLNDRKDHA